MSCLLSWFGDRCSLKFWGGGRLVRFAAINLLVGAAKRADSLEGLNQPEGEAGLLTTRAPAYHAIHAALGERPCALGYRFIDQEAGVSSRDAPQSSAKRSLRGLGAYLDSTTNL